MVTVYILQCIQLVWIFMDEKLSPQFLPVSATTIASQKQMPKILTLLKTEK